VNQYFFPWSSTPKDQGHVIRKLTSSTIESVSEEVEELRICETNLQQYLENKSKLFYKLNKYPFDLNTKKELFFFSKEKINENIKKSKPQEHSNPIFERRYSEENSCKNIKGLALSTIRAQRSNSKPNLGNLSNVCESKNNNYWKKSQRYVNFMRPSTNNRKIKELALQKLSNRSLNQDSNYISFYKEEDPYKLGEALGEKLRKKDKIYANLKRILNKL
jgi:hypothetical protein